MLWPTRRMAGMHGVGMGTLLLLVVAAGMAPRAGAEAAGVVIVSPRAEETIHDNTGNVTVTVTVRNGGAAQDAPLRVLLDGQPYGPLQHARSFTLAGVERGEHTLQVQLTDAAGEVVASSDAVKFYLWQASRLFPGRK
ncbi:MAG: hypothetical protein ACK4N4_03650 [Burkholderiales bacterium]